MNQEFWVVSMVDRGGLTHSSIAKNRDDAVSAFMSYVYMFVHSFPRATFRIVGDDNDAALTGLHCLMPFENEWLCVISMTSPGVIEPQPESTTFGWGDARFVQIAEGIETAVSQHQSVLSAKERNRLARSAAAVTFPRNGAEALIEGAQENHEPTEDVSAARAAKVWNAMARVRQFVCLNAVIR